jgi:peroxiredoxin
MSAESVVTEQPADVEEEVPEEPATRKSTLKMATDFTLPDGNGNMVNLADELQENEQVVLVFYYGDTCPLCMAQLSEIENDRARYEEKGAQVIAIAVQDELGAGTSGQVSNAQFPILAGDKAVAEAYGVFESLSGGFDVGFGSSTPSVFIINKDQEIVWGEISHIEGSGCGKSRIPSQTILENLG